MPTRSPSLSNSPLPSVADSFEPQKRKNSVEDWSDMADGEDEIGLNQKVAQVSSRQLSPFPFPRQRLR